MKIGCRPGAPATNTILQTYRFVYTKPLLLRRDGHFENLESAESSNEEFRRAFRGGPQPARAVDRPGGHFFVCAPEIDSLLWAIKNVTLRLSHISKTALGELHFWSISRPLAPSHSRPGLARASSWAGRLLKWRRRPFRNGGPPFLISYSRTKKPPPYIYTSASLCIYIHGAKSNRAK